MKTLENIFLKLFGVIFNGNCAVYDRYVWLRKNLIFPHDEAKFLDIGCGNGWSLFLARKKSINNNIKYKKILGLSNSIEDISKIKKREKLIFKNSTSEPMIEVMAEDAKNLDKIFNEKFDVIINTENIEHIIDDNKLLKDISNLLNKNGLLYFSTPNILYKELYEDEVIKKEPIEDGGHVVRGYSLPQITKMLKENDLDIISTSFVTGPLSIRLYSLQRFAPYLFLKPFYIPISFLFNFIDQFLFRNYENALSIAIVAQKNNL